jgi:TrmH family RNA methyltransferase
MAKDSAVRFVMVRPHNALNMGAVARAMANFGFDDLAVVSPYEPRWRDAQSAIYGSDLLKSARLATLEEAVADCRLILGTASAHNRAVRRTMVTLPTLRTWLRRRNPKGGRLAVLLGSEKNGLDNDELSHCHAILRIPTEKDAPSMNLGQAAALIAYELSKPGLERSVTEPDDDETLPDGRQLDGLVETALRAMAKAGLNAHMTEPTRRQKLRRGFLRWRMDRGDAAWLRSLLSALSR